MSGPRVLRLSHSAVVPEYRERERTLRERHGWDVHLAAPPAWSEGGRIVRAEPGGDVPVHVLPIRGRRHPILFWYRRRELRRLLRELRPALVDLHEEPYSLAAAVALRAIDRELPGTPVVVYTAQNIEKRYPPPFRQIERRCYRRSAGAYPCSAEAGQVLRRKGYRGAIHVIPLGVSADTVALERNGPPRVGFVGRLVPEKGAHVALEGFARATPGDGTVLEILGAGPEEARLRELADRLQVAARVQFPGAVPQDEALARIASLDVLVVPSLTTPSWKEQFGRVAAQAMAAGTPVLASDSGSLAEVVGDAGMLFREGDPDDLSAKLRALLADRTLREELSERARRRAADEFSWERISDRVDALYREALARG